MLISPMSIPSKYNASAAIFGWQYAETAMAAPPTRNTKSLAKGSERLTMTDVPIDDDDELGCGYVQRPDNPLS